MKTIMDIFQLLGGFLLGISYIPMIKLLFKTKSAKNQSISFWIILVVGLFLFELNALYLLLTLGQFSYAISQTINLVFASIVLIQLLIYKNRK